MKKLILMMIIVFSGVSFGRDFEYDRDFHRASRIEMEGSMEKNGRTSYEFWGQTEEKSSEMSEECVSTHSVRGSER